MYYCFIFHYASLFIFFFFFFNDTATTEIYTLSLHDALPIFTSSAGLPRSDTMAGRPHANASTMVAPRSEEHTSELQSRRDLVCRLLLEKKKNVDYFATSLPSMLLFEDDLAARLNTTALLLYA